MEQNKKLSVNSLTDTASELDGDKPSSANLRQEQQQQQQRRRDVAVAVVATSKFSNNNDNIAISGCNAFMQQAEFGVGLRQVSRAMLSYSSFLECIIEEVGGRLSCR